MLGGSEVDLFSREQVLASVRDRLREPAPRLLNVASANLDHLHHFGIDSGREGCFDNDDADWLMLLDGMPLVWAARRMTGGEWQQLAGSDLLPDVLRVAARERSRVGFLGGSPRQHEILATTLPSKYPDLDLAGFWSPSREVVNDPEASAIVAEEIAQSRVDLLVVGLGKPRQEDWLLRHGEATGAKVALAFGAAADFMAGTVERAPERWRQLGMEWAYRLIKDPKRLARRYLVQGPASAARLIGQSHELTPQAEPTERELLTAPHRWGRRLGRVLVAGDVASIAVASFGAYVARGQLGDLGLVQGFAGQIPVALAVLPMWIAILQAFGCYRPQYFNAGGEGYRRFLAGSATAVLSIGFASFALNLQVSRLYVLVLAALSLVLGTVNRTLVRTYLRRARDGGRFQQNVLIVGANEDGGHLAGVMTGTEAAGYRAVGFVDDEAEIGADVCGLPVLGRPADILDLAFDTRSGLVVVSPSGVRPGTLRALTLALEGSDVDLAVSPGVYETAMRRVTVEAVGSLPIMHVDQIRLSAVKTIAKRTLDVVAGTVALLVALPVLIGSAIAVRLDSPGPVVFRQTRVGRDGTTFTLFKFRTMVEDAEAQLPALLEMNEAGDGFFKLREDPRVTRVGARLRRWSLDELPQLLNVLRGELSLVGPRPPVPREVEKYEAWHLRRLRVKPGITGVWQTSGRSDINFEEAVRMDLFYIENWSLSYDLFLLAKTFRAVLSRDGAW